MSSFLNARRNAIKNAKNKQSSVWPQILLSSLGLLLASPCGQSAYAATSKNQAAKRPNIILILADDLSAHSLGAYGGRRYQSGPRNAPTLDAPVKTPNIDRLAQGGLRFDYVLASPVCSPTRGMLLTGKYNHCIGLRDIPERSGTKELDIVEHPTFAQALRDAGYVTAMAGKWHLTLNQNQKLSQSLDDTNTAHVKAAGFDRQYQCVGAHQRIYWDQETGDYTPDWMQAWVLKFLESRAGQAEPFFLYYAHPVPHKPWRATPLNPDGRQDAIENFPLIMEYFDRQVGEVIDKVAALKMSENTLIIFSGDNGTQSISTAMDDGKILSGGKYSFGNSALVPLIAY